MPKIVPTPVAEVADRWTITKLKLAHGAGDAAVLERQLAYYSAGIDWANPRLRELILDLQECNSAQWETEGAIRRGEADDMDPAAFKALALKVRSINRARCEIKNKIVALLQDGFPETKLDYAGG